ncbi:MAG: hypothetical protein IJ518_03380 [Clostridia bacterium]|nr:hypothetical protein [Clostridia bacterium]
MKVYAHLVVPEAYPGYDETTSQKLTRGEFGREVHFTGLKAFSRDPETGRLTQIRQEVRLFTDELQLCDCLTPHWTTLMAPNFRELVEYVQEKGLYIGNFWGFVPGFEVNPAQKLLWGEFTIPEEAHTCLTELLGDRFIGYESGENDGRYIGSYALRSAVAGRSHQEGYRAFLNFVEKIGNTLHGRILHYCSINTAHYLAKMGNVTILGAETGQSLLNGPMWYGFIRGAAKQYGLLTFGAPSVWNRWGYKSYESAAEQKDGLCWGPTKGTSISLMRRLLYQQYFYNCSMLGLQQNWLCGDDSEKWTAGEQHEMKQTPGLRQLSPIGQVQYAARRFARTHGHLGVFHAPVALMLDFYAGWVPPRHLYSAAVFKTWGAHPYRMGDYQAHALFTMLYPGYENAGWYSDESGFLTATPLGDMTDVLLSDADEAVLRQYSVLLLTNDIDWTYEFYCHILQYIRNGGHVVVCASVLARHRQHLEALDKDYLSHFGLTYLGGSLVLGDQPVRMGEETYPQAGLQGYTAILTSQAEVIATVGQHPFIYRVTQGEGQVSVILSDTGMEPCDTECLACNTINNDIVLPYIFTPAVQAYLETLYRENTPVWPTNRELQFSVAVEDATHVVLQVSNNAHYVQAFSIESDQGIQGVEVISPEDGTFLCEGYYPEGVPINNEALGGSGDHELTAGDICFYRITLSQPLTLQAPSVPRRRVPNLYVRLLPGNDSLRQFVIEHPTFQQTFTGVQIDAAYLLKADLTYLAEEAAFLRRQGVRILVDFLPFLDHYPGLSFLQSFPRRREESMHMVRDILRRAELFDCAGILVSVVRDAEIQGDLAELQRSMLEVFEYMGECTHIPLYMVNRPIVFQIDEAYGLAEEACGMRLALDTCSALCVDASMEQVQEQHAIRSLFISAPVIDRFDQRYDAHRPVYSAEAGEEIRRSVEAAGDMDFTVMAAEYRNWDEVIRDYRFIFLSDC